MESAKWSQSNIKLEKNDNQRLQFDNSDKKKLSFQLCVKTSPLCVSRNAEDVKANVVVKQSCKLKRSNEESTNDFSGDCYSVDNDSRKVYSSSAKHMPHLKQEPKENSELNERSFEVPCHAIQNSNDDSLKCSKDGENVNPSPDSETHIKQQDKHSMSKTMCNDDGSTSYSSGSNNRDEETQSSTGLVKSSTDLPNNPGNRDWDERPHWCEVCGKGFRTKVNLRSHVAIHSEKKPHSCELCGKAFKTRDELSNHFAYRHSEERPHSCDVCGKAFKTQNNLRAHLITHSEDRPHLCDLCGEAFKRRAGLSKHLAHRHLEERPYSCEACGKAFKTRTILKNHLVTHSEEWPHVCDLCGRAFKRRGDLSMHLATHSEERPHVCELCAKAFKTRSDLSKHRSSRHSERRLHSCDSCGKTFKTRGHLRGHVLTHGERCNNLPKRLADGCEKSS